VAPFPTEFSEVQVHTQSISSRFEIDLAASNDQFGEVEPEMQSKYRNINIIREDSLAERLIKNIEINEAKWTQNTKDQMTSECKVDTKTETTPAEVRSFYDQVLSSQHIRMIDYNVAIAEVALREYFFSQIYESKKECALWSTPTISHT
jgi:hypothetical protein